MSQEKRKKVKVENGYNPLSPRHPSPFQYKEKRFINVYQFMLYCQLKNANLEEDAQKVLMAKNNSEVYKLDIINTKGNGRRREQAYGGKLKENMTSYLAVGFKEKYKQNPHLREQLQEYSNSDVIFHEGVFNKAVNECFIEGFKEACKHLELINSLSDIEKRHYKGMNNPPKNKKPKV